MITLSKSRIATACLALAAWLPLQANAALFDDDEARKAILALRAEVAALKSDVNARFDQKAEKTIALDMVNQNEQTRSEIAKLRGQLEVLTNELVTLQKRQKDLYVDLETRLAKLEPRQVTIDGREAAVDPNEQRLHDAAMALLQAGDYKGAAAGLNDFVRRYPGSGYAANAHYFLGTAYYAQRDYKNAIAAQQVVVASYRDSAKAPDALLNIGTIYTEMKDKKNAKKWLQELVTKYPDSNAADTARTRLVALK